jgi:2-dehydro-3-deoxygluconokinase
MATLLTLGETMGVAGTTPGTPLATAGQLRLSTAGAEATVAIGMQRLGHTAAWVGTVGDDEIGRRVLRDLRAEGVDTRYVRCVAGAPTGFMVRDHRTPDYVSVSYYRTGLAGALLCPADVDAAFAGLGEVAVLHLTGITPLLSATCRAAVHRAIDLAGERGATVSFDVNYRRTLAEPDRAGIEAREVLTRTDLLFVGDDETHLLVDEPDPPTAARVLAASGPSEVVVKRGSRGACAATRSGEFHQAPALDVAVVDVIGAGDSFVAGYLAARADGLDIPGRLAWATVCAACTVGTHGDWEGLPTRDEVEVRARAGLTVR